MRLLGIKMCLAIILILASAFMQVGSTVRHEPLNNDDERMSDAVLDTDAYIRGGSTQSMSLQQQSSSNSSAENQLSAVLEQSYLKTRSSLLLIVLTHL